MASNVDPIVLNYSRPMVYSSTTPPPRPLRSPSRARTDDESKRPKPLLMRNRARAQSLPRARAASPSSPVSSISTHAPSLIQSSNKRQRESVQSQQSSLYPPSTVTSQSAFSGPETPPSPPLPLGGASLLDADDVSYRLKLLVKNNYFLPPPHVKPSPQQLSSLPTTPVKSPTLRGLFRPVKSTPKSPPVPPIPEIPVIKPRQTRPQNRVVVIRETLPDLAAEPLPQSEDYFNAFEEFVDPTTDSDAQLPTPRPQPQPRQSKEGTQQPDWREDLLQQAVGLSLVNRPPRKESLPQEQTRGFLGQPISSLAGVTAPPRDFQSRNPSDTSTTALRPPPRSIKERTRAVEEIANSGAPSTMPDLIIQSPSRPSLNGDHESGERVDDQDVHSQGRQTPPARPSFSPSPRPSLAQTLPYSSSPFGHPLSPPPRFSAATDHTQSTTTFHYEDHELTPFNASRPSFTASSVHSMPRPSFSESHVSHYSATFGERGRESISHYSTRSHETDGRTSKRSSLAYLRGTSRSRSVSPSRVRSHSPPPPMPPLPSGSDTEGHSTIIYVHPSGAVSNTAISSSGHGHARNPSPIQTASTPPHLDPKRGITNAPIPQSPSSPRFLSFMSPKLAARSLPLDVDVVLAKTTPDAPSENTGRSPQVNSTCAIESWRDAQVSQEEARKFEGMLMQHIESEKDRFKRIASRGRLND